MNGLGKRISELRQRRGFTLPQLAERAGVAKGYLWTLETHLAPNPGVRVVIRIADALDVSVMDILYPPSSYLSRGPQQ